MLEASAAELEVVAELESESESDESESKSESESESESELLEPLPDELVCEVELPEPVLEAVEDDPEELLVVVEDEVDSSPHSRSLQMFCWSRSSPDAVMHWAWSARQMYAARDCWY